MNICSDGHGEVCHDGRYCPACEEIKELKSEIEDLEDKILSLQDDLKEI